MWEVEFGTASSSKYQWNDDGESAYRCLHVEVDECLGIPFGRSIDAERACEMLNRKIPCDGEQDPLMVKAAWNQEFGSSEKLQEYLVGHCCSF